jgi:type IV pilus assembly protein PilW
MNRQHGFSLVEMMIAMTLGLLVIAAASSIFLASRNSYKATSGVAALSDDTRFSTDFLSRAVRGTGLIGCAADNSLTSTPPGQLITVAVPVTPLTDFGDELSGYEAHGTGTTGSVTLSSSTSVSGDSTQTDWKAGGGTTPTGLPGSADFTTIVGSGTSGGLVGLAVQGSDILVLHNTVQQEPLPVNAAISTGATSISTGIPLTAAYQANWLAAVSNCAFTSVFQISSIGSSSLSVPNTSFINAYDPGTLLSMPTTSIFFIAPGADGDGALWRGDFNLPQVCSANATCVAHPGYMVANEVVPDVENMQVLYGVDPLETGAVTTYQTADQVANFNSVESVRIGLLIASPPATTPIPSAANSDTVLGTTVTEPIDARQRRVIEITVALRNALH